MSNKLPQFPNMNYKMGMPNMRYPQTPIAPTVDSLLKQRAYEREQQAKYPTFADYNNPYEINSVADVILTTFNKDMKRESFFGLEEIPILNILPAYVQYGSKYIWKPFFKGDFAAAGVNTLINMGETLDVLANPVKALATSPFTGEDPLQAVTDSMGWGANGRKNYDYNTGNWFADLALEVVSDPLNWVSFGAKAAATSTAKKSIVPAMKAVAPELSEEASEKIAKKAVKEFITSTPKELRKRSKTLTSLIQERAARMANHKVLKFLNDPDISADIVKRLANLQLDDATLTSLTSLQKLIGVKEGFEKALFQSVMGTTPFGLGFWVAKHGVVNPIRKYMQAQTQDVLKPYKTKFGTYDIFKHDEAKKAWTDRAWSLNKLVSDKDQMNEALFFSAMAGNIEAEQHLLYELLKSDAIKDPLINFDLKVQRIEQFAQEKLGISARDLIMYLNTDEYYAFSNGKHQKLIDTLNRIFDEDQHIKVGRLKNWQIRNKVYKAINQVDADQSLTPAQRARIIRNYVENTTGRSIKQYFKELQVHIDDPDGGVARFAEYLKKELDVSETARMQEYKNAWTINNDVSEFINKTFYETPEPLTGELKLEMLNDYLRSKYHMTIDQYTEYLTELNKVNENKFDNFLAYFKNQVDATKLNTQYEKALAFKEFQKKQIKYGLFRNNLEIQNFMKDLMDGSKHDIYAANKLAIMDEFIKSNHGGKTLQEYIDELHVLNRNYDGIYQQYEDELVTLVDRLKNQDELAKQYKAKEIMRQEVKIQKEAAQQHTQIIEGVYYATNGAFEQFRRNAKDLDELEVLEQFGVVEGTVNRVLAMTTDPRIRATPEYTTFIERYKEASEEYLKMLRERYIEGKVHITNGALDDAETKLATLYETFHNNLDEISIKFDSDISKTTTTLTSEMQKGAEPFKERLSKLLNNEHVAYVETKATVEKILNSELSVGNTSILKFRGTVTKNLHEVFGLTAEGVEDQLRTWIGSNRALFKEAKINISEEYLVDQVIRVLDLGSNLDTAVKLFKATDKQATDLVRVTDICLEYVEAAQDLYHYLKRIVDQTALGYSLSEDASFLKQTLGKFTSLFEEQSYSIIPMQTYKVVADNIMYQVQINKDWVMNALMVDENIQQYFKAIIDPSSDMYRHLQILIKDGNQEAAEVLASAKSYFNYFEFLNDLYEYTHIEDDMRAAFSDTLQNYATHDPHTFLDNFEYHFDRIIRRTEDQVNTAVQKKSLAIDDLVKTEEVKKALTAAGYENLIDKGHLALEDCIRTYYVRQTLCPEAYPDLPNTVIFDSDIETGGFNGRAHQIRDIALFNPNEPQFQRSVTDRIPAKFSTLNATFIEHTGETIEELDALIEYADFLRQYQDRGVKVVVNFHNGFKFDRRFILNRFDYYLNLVRGNEELTTYLLEAKATFDSVVFRDSLVELRKQAGERVVDSIARDKLYYALMDYTQGQKLNYMNLQGAKLIQPVDTSIAKKMQDIGKAMSDYSKKSPVSDLTIEYASATPYFQLSQEIWSFFRLIGDANHELNKYEISKSVFSDPFFTNTHGLHITQALYTELGEDGVRRLIPGVKMYGVRKSQVHNYLLDYFDFAPETTLTKYEMEAFTRWGKIVDREYEKIGPLADTVKTFSGEIRQTLLQLKQDRSIATRFLKHMKVSDDYLVNYALLKTHYHNWDSDVIENILLKQNTTEAQDLLSILSRTEADRARRLITQDDILLKSEYSPFLDLTKETIKQSQQEAYVLKRQLIQNLKGLQTGEAPAYLEAGLQGVPYFESMQMVAAQKATVAAENRLAYLASKAEWEAKWAKKDADSLVDIMGQPVQEAEQLNLFSIEKEVRAQEFDTKLREDTLKKELKMQGTVERFLEKDIDREFGDPQAWVAAIQETIDHFNYQTKSLTALGDSFDEHNVYRSVIQRRSSSLQEINNLFQAVKKRSEDITDFEVQYQQVKKHFAYADELAQQQTHQVLALSNEDLFSYLVTKANRMIAFSHTDYMQYDWYQNVLKNLMDREQELKDMGIHIVINNDTLEIGLGREIKLSFLEGKFYTQNGEEIIAPALKELDHDSAAKVFADPEDLAIKESYLKTREAIRRNVAFNGEATDSLLGSLGECTSYEWYSNFYDNLSKEMKDILPHKDEFIQESLYHTSSFNHSSLGSIASRRIYNPYLPSEMMSLYKNTSQMQANYLNAKVQYMQMFFDENISINNGIMKDMSSEDILKALRDGPEYKLAALVEDGENGARMIEIIPFSVKDIDRAKKLNAVLMSTQTFSTAYRSINKFEFNSSTLNLWHKIIYVYKAGYLMSPGTVMRNAIDSTLKNYVTSEDPIGMTKSYIDALRIYPKYRQCIREIMAMDPDGRILLENAEAYFLNGLAALSKEEYLFTHGFFTDGPASLVKELEDYYSAGHKPDTLFGAFVEFSQAMMRPNAEVEQISRFAEYIWAIKNGFNNTAAFEIVSKTHFDYNLKSNAERLTELIIPFYTFKTRNLEYWINAITEKPWLARNLNHIMTPIWDFDEEDAEEIKWNRSLQYRMLSGNLPLDESLTLKLSPSFMDAFNIVSDPVNTLKTSVAAPLQVASELIKKPDKETLIENLPELTPIAGTAYMRYGEQGSTYYKRTQNPLTRVIPDILGTTFRSSPRPRKQYAKRKYAKRAKMQNIYIAKPRSRKYYPRNFYRDMYTSTGVSRFKLSGVPVTARTIQYKLKDLYHYFR